MSNTRPRGRMPPFASTPAARVKGIFGLRQHSPAVVTVKADLNKEQDMSPLCIGEANNTIQTAECSISVLKNEHGNDKYLTQLPIKIEWLTLGRMSRFSLRNSSKETPVLHTGAPIVCKLDGKWTQIGVYSPDTEFKGHQHQFLPLDEVYTEWMKSTAIRIGKYGRRDRY
ncbi:hypothetical protein M513_11370 [Trichuris suis]|uniref:Uncharacterized protein n=1 Tax=Trichuris suis TaxID=68888 RepID=A0A085LS12_9BILA|nr:hypothetical protein M513_11370 [Trichuris suis]